MMPDANGWILSVSEEVQQTTMLMPIAAFAVACRLAGNMMSSAVVSNQHKVEGKFPASLCETMNIQVPSLSLN